ncbi:anti-sigma-V factor rsiV [Desulfotomaculum sp. 1211_IL3151]|uniref:anti-sigma-V factor rsiV n=1 Tax=Desulfotomaculum sp. 1211_IL3151 TaxID=3084055 RepID=UPI002FD8F420
MKDKNLEQLKREYLDVPIPKELDFVVNKALKDGSRHHRNMLKRVGKVIVSLAAAVALFTAVLNVSPAFAKTVAEVPFVGNIVKVLTFRNYIINEDTFQADINVPQIQGLANKDLENSLNEKYLLENKKLYDQFMADMEEIKKNGGGHIGIYSGYEVKTDNEVILAVARYVVNTAASSSTTIKYDTIDKQKQTLITLPSLFKEDRYVAIISENIKQQMSEQMKSDENKIYWIEFLGRELSFEPFDKIAKDQNFYINEVGNLVISFNKYEVAPGYMGTPEFIIPTEVIADILVGHQYIK